MVLVSRPAFKAAVKIFVAGIIKLVIQNSALARQVPDEIFRINHQHFASFCFIAGILDKNNEMSK